MQQRTEKIREMAKQLLADGAVDVVIGYRKGTVAMREQPFVAHTPEEADELVWTGFCCNNLANLMPRREDKVGVVAQGCVSRNIVGLIQENQVDRDRVKVIGVPCLGMVSKRKVEAAVDFKPIFEAIEDGDKLIVKGKGFGETLERKQMLRDNCFTCQHRNPVIDDGLVCDKVDDAAGGDIDKMAAPWADFEPGERWEKFQDSFSDCIRCYACRDACPLCYCHVCFVDEAKPQWCGKTQDTADVQTFHILRAFHCAGRCTDCGACESACPMDIKMRLLTSRIERDVRERYDYKPGMDIKATPPMSVYRPNDPQEFIK